MTLARGNPIIFLATIVPLRPVWLVGNTRYFPAEDVGSRILALFQTEFSTPPLSKNLGEGATLPDLLDPSQALEFS